MGSTFDPGTDDFGGYDFAQLLVSRRAVLGRPAAFWHYLSHSASAQASFQFLPGTRFISRRVDLSPHWGFNKCVSHWFERMWHLLLDRRFFPELSDAGNSGAGRDLRAFT